MGSDYDPYAEEPKRPRRFLPTLIIAGVAFVAGLLAMGYLLTNWGTAAQFLKRPAAILSPQPEARPAPPPAQAGPVADQPTLGARIEAIDARIARMEARASAASGNASRAEALLIAVAARRALDSGGQLGYIEALLSDRFGRTQPRAVATIISAADASSKAARPSSAPISRVRHDDTGAV